MTSNPGQAQDVAHHRHVPASHRGRDRGPMGRWWVVVKPWWPLALVALASLVMAAVRAVPWWSGLVHAAALPPLDLAFDLRVAVVRAPSYLSFLLWAGTAVVVRTAVLGAILVSIGAVRSVGTGLARAAKLYVTAVIPLAVAATLDFAGLAALYAWYAWAGLVLTILTATLLAPRALAPPGTRLRRIPRVLGYTLAVSVVGAAAELAGPWGAAMGVLVSAVLTAFALTLLVRPRLAVGRHIAGAVALLTAVTLPASNAPLAQVAPNAVLLVVPGVDTSTGRGAAYRLDAAALGFPCERVFYYSYRGPDQRELPAGEAPCPIRLHRPYAQPATQRPLAQLVESFAQQLEAIEADTGGAPVVVVTHSQGAVIAWSAVAEGRAPAVRNLIALAGFPHSPVGYPPPGEAGPGRVGADVLRVLSWFSRFLGGGAFDPDAPLAREILARPDGLESVFERSLGDVVRTNLLFATGDLLVAPEGHDLPHGGTVTIGTTHVGIVRSADATAAIRAILSGSPPAEGSTLAAFLDPALPAWVPPFV